MRTSHLINSSIIAITLVFLAIGSTQNLYPLLNICQAQSLGQEEASAKAPQAAATDPLKDSSQATQSSFLPVWKLLNMPQKQQFVAGYLQGWRDAATVTDIAIAYIKENPHDAINGLERIKTLYDLSGLKPELVVQAIDKFYADPDNGNAPLSLAITAARNE